MKILSLILCLLLCLLAAAWISAPGGEFLIEGRVDGLGDGTVISLTKWDGNTGRRIAQDTMTDGRFSFTVPMTENAKLSLSGNYDDDRFPSYGRDIWAVPGEKVTVTGTGAFVYTWKVESRVPEQAVADAYMLQSEKEYNRIQQLSVESNKARAIANRNTAMTVMDSLETLENAVQLAIFRNHIALMDRTPVSDIWLDELKTVANMVKHYETYAILRDDALRLYEKLTPEQKALPAAQDIGISLFPPEKAGVGDRMADTELKAIDGTMHRLSDYLGKYIFLDFWNSGCGPCLQSVPEMGRVAEKYPDRLKIIGINLDTSEEGWRQGTEMFKYESLNLNAPPASDIDERYGVNGIPHFVIISPEGMILDQWTGYGPGIIERRLDKYLKND